jgi:hypothetical protein
MKLLYQLAHSANQRTQPTSMRLVQRERGDVYAAACSIEAMISGLARAGSNETGTP